VAILTCHTDDCENAEQGIELSLTYQDDDGNPMGVDAVQCGVCGQPITDISNDERQALE
jgi:hypothetical protein